MLIDFIFYLRRAVYCRHNFDPERTIMVGDRLNTDIQFGKAGGLATLLVLTGAGVSPHFHLPLDRLSRNSHDLVVRYHLGGKSDRAQPIDRNS